MARKKKSGHAEQHSMAEHLDEVRDFQDFKDELLPKIRHLLKKGATSKEILELGESLAAARLVTLAAREEDSQKALGLLKELLGRTAGPIKAESETTHKFDKVADEQLDALLLDKLKKSGKLDQDDDEETLQ